MFGHRTESPGKCPFVCTRIRWTCLRYVRAKQREHVSSCEWARSSAARAALLMARKAPSYTNFSRELCYFEHEHEYSMRRVDVPSARRSTLSAATRNGAARSPAKWKKCRLQITRPRLPADNYARSYSSQLVNGTAL